ncbi:MAG: L,D-transpeptidase [Armatimonadota bacterium]|nr:L,D-transpeptidase [bacterium]
MLRNKLGRLPVLCALIVLLVPPLLAGRLSRHDVARPVHNTPRVEARASTIEKAVEKTPTPIVKPDPKPETAIQTVDGTVQVPLAGKTATYAKPLRKLLAEKGITHPRQVELEIDKSERTLKLEVNGEPVKTYVAALGKRPDVPKIRRGDYATPVGNYYVCQKNPNSRFFLALKLAYPGNQDAERGVRDGLIDPGTANRIKRAIARKAAPPMDTKLGGNICIHGGGSGTVESRGGKKVIAVDDWTAGCIALDNPQMKELFDFVPLGTQVRITP